MRLSQQEMDDFEEQGYILLKGFASVSLCDKIKAKAQAHLTAQIEPLESEHDYHESSKERRTQALNYDSQEEKPKSIRRLRQVYQRDPLFASWMENIDIRPILEQILDDQVVLTTAHHNSIMTKSPHSSTATAWHQDRRYWRYSDDNLVSVWLALDEENTDNGVLEFIAGSHILPFSPEQFDEKDYFDTSLAQNTPLLEQKVSLVLEKGDVLIFHSLLLHRANKNKSDKTKISFVYTVKGKKTQAIEGTRSAEYPEIVLDKTFK